MCKDAKTIVDRCGECLSDINQHANGILKSFDERSAEMFAGFELKQAQSLTTQAIKADDKIEIYLKKQGEKHDEVFKDHLKKQKAEQAEDYKQYLDQKDKRENRNSSIMVAVLVIFASVVGYNFINQRSIEKDIIEIKYEVDSKPSKKEIPTMNEIRMLRELGDQYNSAIFLRKNHIEADTSAYYWAKINIYGSTLRGGSEYYKEAYDSVKFGITKKTEDKMNKKLKDIFMYSLAGLTAIITLVLICVVFIFEVPERNHDIALMMLGQFKMIDVMVYSYFFNSTKSSSEKNDMIYNSTPINKPNE